ncbi:MAG TPA: PAS domain S-box protein [Thermoanaerobaculia bacterium]|nr:PAS domain S-box protein [Thermoanaerobaculia bacterium]
MHDGKNIADVAELVRNLLPGDGNWFDLIEHLPVGVCVYGAHGEQVYGNAAAADILGEVPPAGASAAERATRLRTLIAGTGKAYPAEQLPSMRAVRGEHLRIMDLEVDRGDRRLVLDVAACPLTDPAGKAIGAVSAFTDITAAAQTERAYGSLVARLPAGVYSVTLEGEFLLANPAMRAMLGYGPDESLAEANLERDHTNRPQRLVFRRMLAERGEVRSFESTWRRRDGSVVYVSQNASAIRDDSGRILSIEGIVEDITERKRTQEELRENRERYRQLVENANDIIYRTDAYGNFTYVNPTVRKILGYTEEELLGRHFTDLIGPEHRELARAFYNVQFQTRAPNTYFEFPVLAKHGEPVWLGQNVQIVVTGHWVLGFQAVARDISERKRMETELGQARDAALESARIKSEFLANMSHEIRTPMNGMVGMADLLLRTVLSPEQRDYAQTIRGSAETLLTLVDDILDLSKIEAGKLTVKEVDFDLDELIDAITDLFAERAAAKGLHFRAVIYPDVHRRFHGDALRLRQVLMNLIGNALKFTEVGEVNLSVMREKDTADETELWFLVNDTGIGISETDQQRLFTPFTQADGSSTRRYAGTGLGLAISRQLIDMLGGRIGVASSPGEGSTFWFTLTFRKDLRPEGAERRPVLAGVRALLVDSNEMNRMVLRRHLASSSVMVDEAVSGADALSLLRATASSGHAYDVVIMDMQLSGSDGISVAREMHEDPMIRATPIVLVTVIGRRKSDVEFFRAEGIDAFVIKPVRRAPLAAAVAQVIRRLPDETAPASQPETAGVLKHTILVVEDNIVNQKVAVGQLRQLGYPSEVAGNGTLAFEALQRRPYDLILLDCQMPDLDGYDVARAIRRMEGETMRVPIVAMTAHTAPGEREKCIEAGMDDYVSKPVTLQRLSEVLGRWLGRREEAVDPVKIAGLQILARSNPTFFRDIASLFREDALLRLHEMRDASSKNHGEALARAAHSLKSSSGNIGATRMYSLCATIESKAKEGKLAEVVPMVEQVALELDRALEALAQSSSTGA